MNRNDLKHLTSTTSFPNMSNVDVYQHKVTFDYTRWTPSTKLKLCNVPWTNEAPYNVVKFNSDELRDTYFSNLRSKTLALTSNVRLDFGGKIRLPVPFDVMNQFNYITADFGTATDSTHLIQHETTSGITKYFYFIENVEGVKGAPNATEITISVDWWTTCINSVTINYMMLKRGHAPMSVTNVDSYLHAPVRFNSYLLAPDVNFGEATNVASTRNIALNGTSYIAIAMNIDLQNGDFGSSAQYTWQTPVGEYYENQGVPSRAVYLVNPADFNNLMQAIDNNFPNIKEGIEGVFFVPGDFVSVKESFTFYSIKLYTLYGAIRDVDKTLLTLTQDAFGFSSDVKDIAKLYTAPYSHIEVTNERGKVIKIAIEELSSNKLNFHAALSAAWPAIGINAWFNGIGGGTEQTVSFRALDTKQISFLGKWYETFMEWSLPIFSIVQSEYNHNLYATFYDRNQAIRNYETARSNAITSINYNSTITKNNNDVTLDNAKISITAVKDNADASTVVTRTNTKNVTAAQTANTSLQVTANSAQNTASNKASTDNTATSNGSLQAMQAYDAGLAWAMQNADSNLSTATAVTNAVGGAINSTVSGAMSGGLGGAVAGLLGGVVGGVTNGINTAWAINAAASKIESSVSYSQQKVTSQQNTNTTINNNNVTAVNTNTTTANTYATSSTANSVNAANTNADNTYNTSAANNQRTYNAGINTAEASYTIAETNRVKVTERDTAIADANKSNAAAAVTNQLKQHGLHAAAIFGSDTATSEDVVKPMLVSANIVTQSKSAIAQAAAQFKRYGYAYNQPWSFSTFNMMTYFTYWECSDVWITASASNAIIERARKYIRNLLTTGVTVWKDPTKIGAVNIYDN